MNPRGDRARLEAREAWVEAVMRHPKARGALPVAVALAHRYVSADAFTRSGRLLAWPSVASLVKVTGRCKRAVQHQLALLQKGGFILPAGQKPSGNNVWEARIPAPEGGAGSCTGGCNIVREGVQDIAPDSKSDSMSYFLTSSRSGHSDERPWVKRRIFVEIRRAIRDGTFDPSSLSTETQWQALATILEGEVKAGRLSQGLAELAENAEAQAEMTFGKIHPIYARVGKAKDAITYAMEDNG